jgi:hypothetical protein
MAAVSILMGQMAFPDLVASLKNAAGLPVDPATITNQAMTSSNPAVVTVENRNASGAADPTGPLAAVTQAVGVSTLTWTGTNPNQSTVTLTADMTVSAAPPDGNAVNGDLAFQAAIPKV